MPKMKIPTIDGPSTRAPGPINTPSAPSVGPAASGAATARGMDALGQGIANAGEILIRREEQSEVSDLNAKFATTQAEFTNKWQETLRTADPGDKTIATKFLEDYDTQTEKLREGVSTKAGQFYFDKSNAELRSHFMTSAVAAQAELAGVKAKNDYNDTVNGLSSSLLKDPSSYDLASRRMDESLTGLVATGMLSKANAMKLRQESQPELSKSALRGWIRLDPGQAKKQLDDGTWDGSIDGQIKAQMYGEVRVAEEGIRAAAERARQEQIRAKATKDNATQNEFIKDLFVDGDFNIQKVIDSDLESFGSGSKEQIIQMANAYNRSGGKGDDPTKIRQIFARITAPDGTPGKIYDENELNQFFIEGGVSKDSLTWLRGEVQGRKTTDGAIASDLKAQMIKTAYSALVKENKLTGMTDPDGGIVYQRFFFDFLTEWDQQIKAGIPARELANPKSPNYMGLRFEPYKRNFTQILQSMRQQFGGRAAPLSPSVDGVAPRETNFPGEPGTAENGNMRQQGETIQQWRKRTGR